MRNKVNPGFNIYRNGYIIEKHLEGAGGRHGRRVPLHLPELCAPDPVHDLHDELDRAAAEGLPAGYPDAGRTA